MEVIKVPTLRKNSEIILVEVIKVPSLRKKSENFFSGGDKRPTLEILVEMLKLS